MSRLHVTKTDYETIEKFTGDLKRSVNDLSNELHSFFEIFSSGRVEGDVKKLVLNLFDKWCLNAGIVPIEMSNGHTTGIEQCLKYLYPIYEERIHTGRMDDTKLSRSTARLSKDLGFGKNEIRSFIDEVISNALAENVTNRNELESTLKKNIYSLYQNEVHKFCIQTSHVIMSRILLYRVLEDKMWGGKSLAPRRLSGESLERYLDEINKAARSALEVAPSNPFINLIETVRRDMEVVIPRVYGHATYDWWVVKEIHRSALGKEELQRVIDQEGFIDTIFREILRRFDRFDLSHIDRDVWKDIYQEFLPYEERQRLGGFYTPDEIVELILDLVGYSPGEEELCKKKLLDPACGSGTFLVEASRRLIDHLKNPMKCHSTDLQDKTVGEVTKSIMEKIRENIYGVDIHPFAQFLTIVNLAFQTIDHFIVARRQFTKIKLEFNIYSGDSLEYDFGYYPSLEAVNNRLAGDRIRKVELKKLNETNFHYVVGNPPWGGVLKGKLSPLFDTFKKEHYKKHELYKRIMTGKVDFYTLFLGKGIEWLQKGGTIGFLTQNRYISKTYGKGIREYLPEQGVISYLIDFGEIGKVFFPKITNYPCITVLRKYASQGDVELKYVEVHRSAKSLTKREIVDRVRKTLDELEKHNQYGNEYVQGYRLRQSVVKTEPWTLSPLLSVKRKMLSRKHVPLMKVFSALQGVTPGGPGSLNIFRVYEKDVNDKGLERQIIPKAIEGEDVSKWKVTWNGKYGIYPYEPISKPTPIYLGNYSNVTPPTIDERKKKLRHEITKGSIKYPKIAEYLLAHYDELASREFEDKTLEEYGKKWYEYHRPRKPKIMLSKPKIVTTRLFEKSRFALDSEGYLPFDSCVALYPKKNKKYQILQNFLKKATKRSQDNAEVVRLYVLSILNSSLSEFLLKLGRKPAQGGYYSISEKALESILLPIDKEKTNIAKEMVETARKLLYAADSEKTLMDRLEGKVIKMFDLSKDDVDSIREYLQKH